MACTVNGDYLVIWGGDNNGVVVNGTVLVYDIKGDRWVTQYKPFSATNVTPGPPIPTGSNPSQPSPSGGNNAAAIGGGVAGAVVLSLVVGLFVYRRRKQSNQKNGSRPLDRRLDSARPDGDFSSLSAKPSLPPYQPPLLSSRPTNIINQQEFTKMANLSKRPRRHGQSTRTRPIESQQQPDVSSIIISESSTFSNYIREDNSRPAVPSK
ncbi:hypothetical protein BGX29_011790 [Mortierella sp. GBA35]|nr:hypothetical protein BGX29_011790 [Mortierella sp. GBA35]